MLGVFCLLVTVTGLSQADLSNEYLNSLRLDDRNETGPTYVMYWTYNSTVNQSFVSFAVQTKALGWIGFGFANKIDEMRGYDVVMGSIDTAVNITEIKDCHTIGHKPPIRDPQQDLMNTSITEEDYFTTLRFTRLVDTKDENDIPIKSGPILVVWSYSNLDDSGRKHVERGYKTVTLIPVVQAAPRSTTIACRSACLPMLFVVTPALFILSWASL